MLRFIRLPAVVAGVALLASSAVALSPSRAAAAPQDPPKAYEDSGARADSAGASVAARHLGRPVEVTGAMSETLQRWANPDGTFTDEVYVAPVRTLQDGEWVDIDTRLALRDGAVRPGATVGDVSFSAGGRGDLASVAHDGSAVSLGWSGVLPAPVLDGSTARYVDALPGVDVELHASRAGFEQSFVLKTPAAAASSARLRLPLSADGLAPRTRRSGIAFTDARGIERVWIGSARMWDATGREAPVGVAVADTARGRVLELTPDAAFLSDPSLVFPVTVDPTVQVAKWRDAYINSGATTTNYGSNAYLKVGTRSGSSNQYVSYIEFPVKKYAGKQITDVTQYLGTVDSVTCSARTTSLYTVTTEWFESSVTWGNRPTTDLTTSGLLAQATTAGGGPVGSSCESNAWMTFNDPRLTAKYQFWADNDASNFGMSIRVDSSDTTAAKDFASGENTSWTPRANITYNNHPATVTGRYVTPAQVDSDGTHHARATKPILAAASCDPDGSPTRIDFEIWNDTKTAWLEKSAETAATVASCATKQWTPMMPLSNGYTYYWRARAYDGNAYSKAWSSWMTLVADTVAPPAPIVSSTTFTANQWLAATAPTPTTAVFTFSSAPSPDVAGYYFGLDDPNPSSFTTNNWDGVVVTEGWHTMYVQAVDKAGNRSSATAYPFGYGHVGVTSPSDGARTSRTLTLAADVAPNVASVTWQRIDSDGTPHDLGHLFNGTTAVSQPIAVTNGALPSLTWNLEDDLAGSADGPLTLMARATTTAQPPASVATRKVAVTYDRVDFAMVNATAAVGPGTVNLVTGNLQVSGADAALDAYGVDLSVGRTFNSRDAGAHANGPFGPGWAISTAVESAGADFAELAVNGTRAALTLASGDAVGFTRTSTSATTFTAEQGFEELSLTYVSTTNPERYELKDLDGNVTWFTAVSSKWLPTAVRQVGDESSTTYAYETVTVNGDPVTRVTAMQAPQPPGVTGCSPGAPTAVVGCRTLRFTYVSGNTPAPTAGQLGDYPHRLQKIEAIACDPDASTAACLPPPSPVVGMTAIDVARFAYDSTGRLREVWDPRLPTLKTAYTYNGAGQLATITPPGEEPVTLSYAPLSGEPADTGRLKSASRPTLLSSAPTATTTLVYRVPVSGTSAPYDLSAAAVQRTGQQIAPLTATAVFPPTTAATFGSGSLPVPTSYDRATIHYLDVDGREVNTADANGGIATTAYDGRGNVVRTLTPGNRQRALDRGATLAEEATTAQSLSSLTTYSADGIDVLEDFGPERQVLLANGEVVRARQHVKHTYDEGMSGGPYHLVTTSVASIRVAGESADRMLEARTTKTEYGTTAAQWALGRPTATTVDPGTGHLNLVSRATYAADGRVLTTTRPSGGTSTATAATRVMRYYRADADGDDSACGNKPAWVNLVCSVAPGGQPATGSALPTTYTTYDVFNQPRVTTEKNGATVLRTTTTTYDAASRPSRTTVTASTGTALPTQEIFYDAGGRATETRALDALGAVTARVVRVYNSLGQLTSYTDTDGVTSTTTYDVAGRPVTTTDGKGTQTRSYDGGTERRGLLTSLADSHAGTWTATYDVDGTASTTWPNGLLATTTVDETGSETGLAYAATSGCTGAACTVYAEVVADSSHGQWLSRAGTFSAQAYTYDAAGRLSEVADTDADGSCTTRRYTFDEGSAGNGNRTKLDTFAAASDGSCQTATVYSTVQTEFDAADRAKTAGTVYDAIGRTTTVPDGDALGAGDVTVGYHVNDLVRSIRLANGATSTYTIDVDQQRIRSWTDGTTTRTNHYRGDGDAPSWTQENAAAWSRNITDISGDLAAIHSSATGTTTLQLTNLHGDVVTTTPGNSTVPSGTMEANEYGAPRGSTTPAGTRYAWLGGKQRAADTPGGLAVMGVRLYNPAAGRFLQVDPIYGGSSTAYDYANQDPTNTFDIDGRRSMHEGGWKEGARRNRVCHPANDACIAQWRGEIRRVRRCPPGMKGAAEFLGWRSYINGGRHAVRGRFRRAAEEVAGWDAAADAGMAGGGHATRYRGKHRVGVGKHRAVPKRGKIFKLVRFGAKANGPVGAVATILDYAC